MVGLENRAGRCALCKRRKIKCDLLRPACTRCSHIGLRCEYPRPHRTGVFINRTVEKPFINALDVLSNTFKKTHAETIARPSPTGLPRTTHQRPEGEEKITVLNVLNQYPEYMTQALSTFLGLYLPEEARGQTKPYQTPASWVLALPNLTLQNSAYNKSLAALCVVQIGGCNHDVALFKESIRLYASALVELRKIIQSGRLEAPEATLASIVILSTYEAFSSSSEGNRGWASHVRGGGKMIQLLGPSIYDSEVGRRFSERIRTISILEALRTRKVSVLESQQWPHTAAKNQNPEMFGYLQDLMIQLPPIMEVFDSRPTASNSGAINTANRPFLTRMLQSCSHLNADLLSWYKHLRTQISGMLYWTVPCMTQSPADNAVYGPVFPLAFEFANLSVAQLLLLYWSTLILLHRVMKEVLQELEQHAIEQSMTQDNFGNLETIDSNESRFNHKFAKAQLPCPDSSSRPYPSNNDIALLAKNICQSMEYCYLTKSGTLGLQSTIFPLWVAQEFYASQPDRGREMSWCSEVHNMTRTDSRYGVKVMRFGKDS